MKVLVIAPHMDDEVLGAGGTIVRHVERGDEVHVCCVAHRKYDHTFDAARNEREMACARKAQEVLGYATVAFLGLADERLDACLQDVIVPLERSIERLQPEIVYVCHRGDLNQDHRAVFHAAMVGLRASHRPSVRSILCYETPSSTEQAPPVPEMAFLPNCYVDISGFLDRKLAALECYETERRQYPHPRSLEAIRTLARRRGIEAGFQDAEAFVQLQQRWPLEPAQGRQG